MTITEFLLARISEDEAAAKNAKPEDWWWDGAYVNMDDPFAAFPVHNNPARVLAECAAKRAIIERAVAAESYRTCDNLEDAMNDGEVFALDHVRRALAAVYKDHPDYEQEWAA